MKNLILSFIAVGLLCLSGCQDEKKTLLLVYSYHPDFEWTANEDKGVMEILGTQDLSIERLYLDTKRHTDPVWMDSVGEAALNRIAELKPALVMLFDDNACRLVGSKLSGSETPVVFCGLNNKPEDYGLTGDNITGIHEIEYYAQSYGLLQTLKPGITRLGLFMDDSPTTEGMLKELQGKNEIPEITATIMTNDFAEWQKQLLFLQDSLDAIGILSCSILKDTLGKTLTPKEVVSWTTANSKIPEFATLDFSIYEGALCGVVESGYRQGKAAAEMAVRILAGEKPSSIPVTELEGGITLINKARATVLGISIPDDVAAAATVIE